MLQTWAHYLPSFRKKEMSMPTAVTMARCHSKMPLALTVMTCICRNLCGWLAVMIQKQANTKQPPAVASSGGGQFFADGSKAILSRRGSPQLTDLLLGNDALDFLGGALDPVTWSSVRLDRQAGGDRINVSLPWDIAALRALKLEKHVVIDRVVICHGLRSFSRFGQVDALI